MLRQVLAIRLDRPPLPGELAALYEPSPIDNTHFDTTGGGAVPWALLEDGALSATAIARVPIRHGKIASAIHRIMLFFGYAPPARLFARYARVSLDVRLRYIPGEKHA